MPEEKSVVKFVIYCGVFLILFLSLLPIVFSFKGLFIRLELILFIFFLLLAFIGLVTYNNRGEQVIFFTLLLLLGNLIFVWFMTQKLFLLPLFVALFGFLLSFPRREYDLEEEKESPEISSELAVAKESLEPAPAQYSKVIHTPGKFAASKYGIVYHAPKCDWAKKIKKKSLIWFSSAAEAKKAGYKAHSCAK